MAASLDRILDARGATRVRIAPDESWLCYVTDITGTPQLWRVPTAGGMPRRLTFDCDRVGAYRISPDGKRIAYATDRGGDERWQLWVMDADGANARRLTEQVERIHHLNAWTADGRSVLAMTNTRDARYFDLWTYPLDGRAPRMLYQHDGTGSDATALPDGGAVVRINRRRGDENHLVLVSPDGGNRVLTPEEPMAMHSVVAAVPGGLPAGTFPVDLIGDSVSLQGDTLAVAWARYDAPATIYISRKGEPFRELVPPVMAGLDASDLPEARLVEWASFDGRKIPGFLITPRGAASGPRPTIIEVHGGPEGQARPKWTPRTVMFVASGFNVLQPNVRGSTGYGKTYQHLDDVALRLDSVRDLDAAAAWLAESGVAPRDRIGVIGQSYGGPNTPPAVPFFPERGWAAAVDVYGIANFLTFFEHTAEWRRPLRAVEYGDPAKDRELLASLSPISRLDAIKAPLMVVHGANDPRVPIQETEQIVAALRGKGREVEYLRYEDEGHSLAKAKNRAHAYPRMLEFFKKHLLA